MTQKERSKRHYEKHKARLVQKQRDYRAANPDKVKETQQKQYQKWADFVDSLKTPCLICGNDEPVVIDFHHLDPSQKSFAISRSTRYGKEKILEERKKCVCLCSNCHRLLHAGKVTLPDDL